MTNNDRLKALKDTASQNDGVPAGTDDTLDLGASATDSVGSDDFAGGLETESEDPWVEADDAFEEKPRSQKWPTFLSAFALLLGASWTGLYAWSVRGEWQAVSPEIVAGWITNWAIPCVLIGMIWLIAMRQSTREADRFGHAAERLRAESEALEARLGIVNRELSLAREFLGAQSRELESVGRLASERISAHANELQEMVQTNGAQVEAIGTTSETALANMQQLRSDLPVLANSARDVANQIGNTGRTANDNLDKLIAGFERLNEFAKASERQTDQLCAQIGSSLGDFEARMGAAEQSLGERFEALKSSAESFRNETGETERQAMDAMAQKIASLQSETSAIFAKMRQAQDETMENLRQSKGAWQEEISTMVGHLNQLDEQAVTAARKRIKELHEEAGRFDDQLSQRDVKFFEAIAERQAEFETRETQASEVLAQRLSALDDALEERRQTQIDATSKVVEQGEALSAQLSGLSQMLENVETHEARVRAALGEGLGNLAEQLSEQHAALSNADQSLTQVTDGAVRLLEIIQAGARYTSEDLPAGISAAQTALSGVNEDASQIASLLEQSSERGEAIGSKLIETRTQIDENEAVLETLQARLSQSNDDALSKLGSLRAAFVSLAKESAAFTEQSDKDLTNALERLEEATAETLQRLEREVTDKAGNVADIMGEQAIQALGRALRNESAEVIGKLEQSAAYASGIGREAALQLRDQLAMVNELTGNLESRVARAREKAEEQVNNDFSRRMALITESLNSSAIDISSALSSDVSDDSWNSYLRGDRGIFTRRAVRLLDKQSAREIARLYQNDPEFKQNVNRYVHDFEAMLRSVLSTRDGNAMSVTLLGSDVGKLYVAIAEAIERLRK